MTNLARSTSNSRLPGAQFSDARACLEFSPERGRYEAAVQTFAAEASPAGVRRYVAALRRRGIRATQADAKDAAIFNLQVDLAALGYTESEIQWHAARRARRDRHLYISH